MTSRIRPSVLLAAFAFVAAGCPPENPEGADASIAADATTPLPDGSVDLCQSVTCNQGETCDTADGICKCGNDTCPTGQVCNPGLRCVDDSNPCATKTCSEPTLPECNTTTGECECRTTPDSCGQGQQCVGGACQTASLCASVTCNDGETCDEADGACKCSAQSCPTGKVCNAELRCVDESGPCANSNCSGTTPHCNDTTGACECVTTPADSCGTGYACVDGACQAVSLCDGVTCADGETCDEADGACKCADDSCPTGQTCSPNLRCVDETNPCATKTCTGTTPVCDALTGECQCVASPVDSCATGEHCAAGECVAGAEVQICNASLPTPANGATCDAVAGTSGKILLTGTVLLEGKVLRGGQVLIGTDGLIACVDCDCSANAAGATTITCPEAVISPSLINTHDHITYANSPPPSLADPYERFEHRHDWRRGKFGHTNLQSTYGFSGGASTDTVNFAELRFVMGGATSTAASGGATGLLRNLDRSASQQEGLPHSLTVDYETFPLGDSGGTEIASGCTSYSYNDPTWSSIDAFLPHIGEGINAAAHNEFVCTQSALDGAHDMVTDKSSFIHGIAAKPADVALMAYDNARLIWSPRSNVSLYGDTAVVPMYDRMGVLVALGTDWLPSGSMNLLREIKCAADLNDTFFGHYFSDEQIWRMVTVNGAKATGSADMLGSLKPGLLGDIAIFAKNGKVDYRAVIEAGVEDVALVLRAGKVLYGDAAAVSALDSSSGCEALDVCSVGKKVCAQRELGKTVSSLTSSEQSKYPLFTCRGIAPAREPSCQPMRTCAPAVDCPANMSCVPNCPVDASVNGSGLYDGTPRVGDQDGDGIADVDDNCPLAFNPIRPMDDGAQADADADGVGDACDPCPLEPNVVVCAAFNPNDRDADTIPDAQDLCPTVYDPTNHDEDGDGKGDVCDACPNFANPGVMACPGSVYDVKKGLVADGTALSISGAVVTGVYTKGFFMQVTDIDAAGYQGAEYSGIYVYTGVAPTVVVGDHIALTTATATLFYGQWEFTNATVNLLSSGAAAPTPVVVADSALIATGGTQVAALEGVLVELSDVTVTDLNPTPDAADTNPNEFAVGTAGTTASVRVHDWLYAWTKPALNDTFAKVTGILHWDYSNAKIEPRSESDLLSSPPRLASLTPATGAKIYVGSNDSTTFDAPLTVNLDKPALADTDVTVAGSTDLEVVGGKVTIPAGQTSAEVHFNAVNEAAAVTVTATLGADTATATVDVIAVTPVATLTLDPASAKVSPNGAVDLTLTTDVPAPPGGLLVDLSVTPDTAGSVSAAQVTVPANMTNAHFIFTAGAAEVAGVVVKATANGGVLVSNGAVIDVEIVYPTALTLSPASGNVAPNGTLAMTVTADVAVYADLTVTLTAGAGGSVPATVVIPAGQDSATFDFTAGPDELPAVTVDASADVPAGTINANTASVEVKAAGGCPVEGWHLLQANSTIDFVIPAGTAEVPGGGYLIVGRNVDQAAFETFWGVTLGADVVYLNGGNAFPVINGAETYTLQDDAATTIDGPSIAQAGSASQSIQRVSFDAADQAGSWSVVAFSGPTSATPGTSALSRDASKSLVISEFSDATGTGAYVYEFVELFCPK